MVVEVIDEEGLVVSVFSRGGESVRRDERYTWCDSGSTSGTGGSLVEMTRLTDGYAKR